MSPGSWNLSPNPRIEWELDLARKRGHTLDFVAHDDDAPFLCDFGRWTHFLNAKGASSLCVMIIWA